MGQSGTVFSVFVGARGVPLERPRLASWQMVMDILDVFLTDLLFASSGFGGVPGGVKKSGLEPSRAQGRLPRVCEAIWGAKQAEGLLTNEIWGVARRSARRCWGGL